MIQVWSDSFGWESRAGLDFVECCREADSSVTVREAVSSEGRNIDNFSMGPYYFGLPYLRFG